MVEVSVCTKFKGHFWRSPNIIAISSQNRDWLKYIDNNFQNEGYIRGRGIRSKRSRNWRKWWSPLHEADLIYQTLPWSFVISSLKVEGIFLFISKEHLKVAHFKKDIKECHPTLILQGCGHRQCSLHPNVTSLPFKKKIHLVDQPTAAASPKSK